MKVSPTTTTTTTTTTALTTTTSPTTDKVRSSQVCLGFISESKQEKFFLKPTIASHPLMRSAVVERRTSNREVQDSTAAEKRAYFFITSKTRN